MRALARTSGAQGEQVGEHPGTFIFELEDYPEAKTLLPTELRDLHARFGGFQQVADLIGASEAFVRQSIQEKKYIRSPR